MEISGVTARLVAPLLGTLLGGLPALAREHGWTGTWGLLARLPDGWGLAFALDAVSFAVAAAALLFLPIPSPRAPVRPVVSSARTEMAAALRFVRARPPLVWLLGMAVAVGVLSAPESVLVPLMLRVNLEVDLAARGMTFDQAYAAITVAASVGGIAGGIFMASWGGLKRRRIDGVLVTLALLGLLQLGYGLATGLVLVIAIAFAKEKVLPALAVHIHVIWQTSTPAELQGRVFGLRRAFESGAALAALALAGLVGGALDPGLFLAGTGLLLFALAIHLFRSPQRSALEALAVAELGRRRAAGGMP
jgi:hypothetical protein